MGPAARGVLPSALLLQRAAGNRATAAMLAGGPRIQRQAASTLQSIDPGVSTQPAVSSEPAVSGGPGVSTVPAGVPFIQSEEDWRASWEGVRGQSQRWLMTSVSGPRADIFWSRSIERLCSRAAPILAGAAVLTVVAGLGIGLGVPAGLMIATAAIIGGFLLGAGFYETYRQRDRTFRFDVGRAPTRTEQLANAGAATGDLFGLVGMVEGGVLGRRVVSGKPLTVEEAADQFGDGLGTLAGTAAGAGYMRSGLAAVSTGAPSGGARIRSNGRYIEPQRRPGPMRSGGGFDEDGVRVAKMAYADDVPVTDRQVIADRIGAVDPLLDQLANTVPPAGARAMRAPEMCDTVAKMWSGRLPEIFELSQVVSIVKANRAMRHLMRGGPRGAGDLHSVHLAAFYVREFVRLGWLMPIMDTAARSPKYRFVDRSMRR